MAKSYKEKLLDPRWQRKRLEVLERDDWTCVRCRSKDKTLHVHHGYYLKGLEPWDYESQTLQTLCSSCHELIGEETQIFRQWVAHLSRSCFCQLMRLVETLMDLHDLNRGELAAFRLITQANEIHERWLESGAYEEFSTPEHLKKLFPRFHEQDSSSMDGNHGEDTNG